MAELSGLEVLVLTKEVELALRDSYVNNIYSLGRAQVFRFRRKDADDAMLVVSPERGAWVSTRVNERMDTVAFTSKLRGELDRAKLVRAEQAQLDRIFVFHFEGTSDRRLILELMPPGNIIVTDGAGRIVLIENEVRSQRRRLTLGMQYEPPSQSRADPRGVEAGDIAAFAGQEKTAGKALGRHIALPKKYVAEALRRLGLVDGSPAAGLADGAERAASVVKGLVEDAESHPYPCLCGDAGEDEIYAFQPTGLAVARTEPTMSALCDEILLQEVATQRVSPDPEATKRKELEATIAKLRSEETAHLEASAKARTAAEGAGRASTVEEAMELAGSMGVRPRQAPRSTSAVASLLYDAAKEHLTKASDAKTAAERLAKKLPRVTPRDSPRNRSIVRERKEWFEKFRWFVTSRGKLAIGGRDAQTNSILVRRHLDAGDTVYHADLFGSPFFILKGGADQTEEEVREVAQATVGFSSAWKTGLSSADAYWVSPDQVSTAAPSGEYLARGSFAIRGKKNFANKNLVEVSLGLDGNGRLMAGPEKAVAAHCAAYLVLTPQREKSSETAKKVLAALAKVRAEWHGLDLDDVARALPPGGGKVVRRKGL